MDFDKFSLNVKHTKVGRFADDLANGRITATKCRKCGVEYYPPRADCHKCMSSDMEWVELKDTKGKLVTYTEIQVPPEHFGRGNTPFSKSEKFQPCAFGIIELENGLKITGWIPTVDVKKIKVGMELKAIPKKTTFKVAPRNAFVEGEVTIALELA